MTGDAPAKEVWDRYARPGRWTSWAPHLTRVESSAAVIVPGATGTVTAAGLLTARFRITEVDTRAMTWSWQVHLGPVRLDLAHRVLERGTRSGSRCTTRVDITGPRPIVLPYLPLMRIAMGRLVRADPVTSRVGRRG